MIGFGHKTLGLALLLCACGHTTGVERRQQPDGSYQVTCRVALARCLTSVAEICPQGYEVLHAQEDVSVVGPREINEPSIASEATVRCRGQGAASPGADKAATPPAAPRCTPGATQTCVGPGACRGGQQCLADGASFGPCDCGGPIPAAGTPPGAAPPDGGS